MKGKLFVVTVAALAIVTAAFVPTEHYAGSAAIWQLTLMGALVALSEACQLRYRLRGGINAFNILEGILAPLIFAGAGPPAMITCACAILVGDCSRRNQPVKVVFNVAQWTLAVGVASVVFHSFEGPTLHAPSSLTALVLALLTLSVVNQLALNTVIFLANGRVLGS